LPKTAAPVSAVQFPATILPDGLSRRPIFPQQLFLIMLCIERKRSERSGKRLVLVLVELPALVRNDKRALFNNVILSLSRSTRDTDIVGWYRDGSVLAVLFTDIGVTAKPIVDLLSRKIDKGLRDVLPIHQMREMKLSFHVFPDDCLGESPQHQAFSIFYADLLHRMTYRHIPRVAKRCMDAVGSFLLLVLLSPLMFLIALAVRITSRGPILFRQSRLGQFGEPFSFLKFRSMYVETDNAIHMEYTRRFITNHAEADDKAGGQTVYKIKFDPRITKVGGFLRRTSLDEIPQLFNVLSGRMSLVGPRPPIPYEFESYEAWHLGRLAVRPGITGIWQVEGRSRVRFDDMVRMDLSYAARWSLWLDITILARTPFAVLGGNGAY
jgi:lipopolysaccharide/colanic/teichoic acid biosynthesis glycosyltransferase